MDMTFGQTVQEEARRLAAAGKDANQIAKILCDRDPEGCNYGIGIILEGDGRPMGSSSTLLEYTRAELEESRAGVYMNSAAMMDELTEAVLRWQRIPERYREHFFLTLPSDAGTGAVRTAIDVALLLHPDTDTLGIDALGWPPYKSIARVKRLRCKEFDGDAVMAAPRLLPVYQAGPINTTGLVRDGDVVTARAQAAAEHGAFVVLDRAYPGFEYARSLASLGYEEIMRLSYERHIHPFVERGVPFALAISPTKSFVTFALRPGGLLLLFCPDKTQHREMDKTLNIILRARGSGFEHPVTRAFVKALIYDRERLEEEHGQALKRLADAETRWVSLVRDTPVEDLFSDRYAGLFRNMRVRDEGPVAIYNEHLYPVLSEGRCRINITGIPDDAHRAARHVAVFAKYCY